MKKDRTYRALTLAVLIETFSCIGIFGDSFSRTAANVLAEFHFFLNLPIFALFHFLGVGPGFEVHNGSLRLTSFWWPVAIALQCGLWTGVLVLLMRLEERVRGCHHL
jgi:hypothetical protein